MEYATPNGERPTGIAVDRGGTVWAGGYDGSVMRLSPDSGDLTQLKAPSGSIYGVTAGDDGAIWAGTIGAIVYSVDPNTGRFEAHELPGNSGSWWTVSGGSAGVWAVLGRDEGNALVLFGKKAAPAGPG